MLGVVVSLSYLSARAREREYESMCDELDWVSEGGREGGSAYVLCINNFVN